MSTELSRRPAKTELANINVGQLLDSIVKSGITADAAGAVKELVLLQEHQQDRDSRQLWLESFARVREKLKTVNAVKAVPGSNGMARWYYAPLEDLQDEVEPILATEELTIRFDSIRDGNICTGICWLSHIGGHEENSKCAINVANAKGGDLGAMTTAKRGALIAVLAIKTRPDGNARMLGDFVSPDMAAELRQRLLATGRSERKFLAMAEVIVPDDVQIGLEDWKRVRQGKLGILHDALRKAEAATQQQKPQDRAANPVGTRVSSQDGASIPDASPSGKSEGAALSERTIDTSGADAEPPIGELQEEPLTFAQQCDAAAKLAGIIDVEKFDKALLAEMRLGNKIKGKLTESAQAKILAAIRTKSGAFA
jgi:hypothetical protein